MIVAGSGDPPYDNSSNGSPAINAPIRPASLTTDAQGNLYFVETSDNRIRKMDAATGILNHFAGGGAALGDGGPAAQAMLNEPRAAVTDAAGNMYIADYGNHRVRRVAPNGVITTVAGTGISGFSGDGGPA